MSIRLKKAIEIGDIDAQQSKGKISEDLEQSRALALMALKMYSYARKQGKDYAQALIPDEFPEQMEL